jgi:hypothetical protein
MNPLTSMHWRPYARRLLRALASTVLLLCMLAIARGAYASNIVFQGDTSYAYVGNVVTLAADRVQNNSTSGVSGTVRLELWAFASAYTGAAETGYTLATYELGTLTAGFGFPSVNTGPIPFGRPPDGTWHFALLVTEFTGAAVDDGFTPRDWVNFTNLVTFGAPPPPPPPPVSSALENPAGGSYQSGIGLISGWSCQGPVSVSVDGVMIAAPYGGPRGDTASICGISSTGFGLLVNYNNFGAGSHTAQLYVSGVPRGSPAFFTVTVPSGDFMRGLAKTISVPNFPSTGRTTTLIWQESQQNFAIQSVFP